MISTSLARSGAPPAVVSIASAHSRTVNRLRSTTLNASPPNALTMKCSDFNKLDEATRLAVIRAILAQKNNPLGPDGEGVGQMLVEAACQFLPQATVSEVLMGSPPP